MVRLVDESFPESVVAKLRTYVYRLIDPRNGETFYVGKGQGNRVFAHIRAEQSLDGDELDNKMTRIQKSIWPDSKWVTWSTATEWTRRRHSRSRPRLWMRTRG